MGFSVVKLLQTSSVLVISVSLVFAYPDGWSNNKNVVFSRVVDKDDRERIMVVNEDDYTCAASGGSKDDALQFWFSIL
ncbi:hypothetical protein ZWY2020_000413 [Hordeum vulgare]|nr:hypothetical protein ZWY2020_000413 [Hordeum vulgare]